MFSILLPNIELLVSRMASHSILFFELDESVGYSVPIPSAIFFYGKRTRNDYPKKEPRDFLSA